MCYDNVVQIVDVLGFSKHSKKYISRLEFSYNIDTIGKMQPLFAEAEGINHSGFLVCLTDSVLAFHKNGMQGRSLRNGEITQEITDTSRIYELIGSDK